MKSSRQFFSPGLKGNEDKKEIITTHYNINHAMKKFRMQSRYIMMQYANENTTYNHDENIGIYNETIATAYVLLKDKNFTDVATVVLVCI